MCNLVHRLLPWPHYPPLWELLLLLLLDERQRGALYQHAPAAVVAAQRAEGDAAAAALVYSQGGGHAVAHLRAAEREIGAAGPLSGTGWAGTRCMLGASIWMHAPSCSLPLLQH